jgi:DNA-binding MarR family transcriptional regulator
MIPTETTDVCAFAGLRRANRAVCHLYDLVLAPAQLKVTQFTMLRNIALAGEIAHCDLARKAGGSEEAFSRRLAAARKSGWVSMRIGTRRRRMYRISEKGEQILREATPFWERAQDRLRRELGDAGWQTMLQLAVLVAEAAMRAESAPRRNSPPPVHTVPLTAVSGEQGSVATAI